MSTFRPSSRGLRHGRRLSVVVAVGGVLILAGGCSSSKSASGGSSTASSASSSAPANSEPINIGTVLPLSGAAAATAGQYLAGFTAAIGAANDAGGVNGHKIDLTKVDDGFEVPRTIAGVKELAQQDNVAAILGPYGTNAAVGAAPIAQQVKVPLIGPLAYSVSLYNPVNPYVFPLLPGQQTIYQALTEYAVTNLGVKKVAVLGNDGEVGDETIAGATEALAAHGLKPVITIREANAQPDYSGIIAQIKSAGADAVMLQSDDASMATFVKNMKNVGLNVPFFGGAAGGDAGFAKLAGSNAEGDYGVVTIDLTGSAPGWAAYTAAVSKYTSADPTGAYTANGYAAAQLLFGAIQEVKGPVTADTLTAALSNHDFPTLGGTVSYTADNHLGFKNLVLTQVKNGSVGVIKSLPLG